MANINPEWLNVVLKKHEQKNKIAKILSIETEPAVNAGDNYCSVILRATLKVVLSSGRITTRKVILKNMLTDLSPEMIKELTSTFNRECIFFNHILPEYEIIMEDNCANYSKIWPDCMYSSKNLIILEDLKISGFTTKCRKIGLDLNHTKFAFVNLARFHSLSMIGVDKGTVNPKLLSSIMDSKANETFYNVTLKSMADVIRDDWGDKWSNVEKKLRSILKDVDGILKGLYDQSHKHSVINHGDCWVSNIMYKDDSEGSPVDLKFVDFQVAHFNSYAWDLSYFLYTSIHPKLISDNYESFIKIYCDEFSSNLKRLGAENIESPTINEVKEEMRRLKDWSIITICSALPMTANPLDIKVDFMDLFNDDNSQFRLLCNNDEFKNIIQEIFKHFMELGYI